MEIGVEKYNRDYRSKFKENTVVGLRPSTMMV
jgi:hypothetical protein